VDIISALKQRGKLDGLWVHYTGINSSSAGESGEQQRIRYACKMKEKTLKAVKVASWGYSSARMYWDLKDVNIPATSLRRFLRAAGPRTRLHELERAREMHRRTVKQLQEIKNEPILIANL
jgi:hypothetical protein